MVLLTAGALAAAVAVAVFLAREASRDPSPQKAMTLAEVQERREETRKTQPAPAAPAPAAQSPAADPPRAAPPDRWSVMKDPTERR